MCSLLCCTDTIAAVSIISYDEQPKLFSMIFGEGVTNDAVAIILFNTIALFTEGATLSFMMVLEIILGFLALGFFSILIGVLSGFASALILKHGRFLTRNPVIEVTLTFIFGNISYVVSELFHMSGIISLLTCGIVMAHYTYYNLSHQAKSGTTVAYELFLLQLIGYLYRF